MRNSWILAALVLVGWPGWATAASPPDRPSVSVPDWAALLPDAAPLVAFYPDAAAKVGLSGTATVRCRIASQGELERCVLLSESPASTFGKAALAAADMMTAEAAPPSAKPDANHVDIPFTFHWPDGMKPSRAPDGSGMATEWMLRWPIDGRSKSYPTEAVETGASGKVELLCIVTPQGLLDQCRVLSERPKGVGFGAAALDLSQWVTMTPRMVDHLPEGGKLVLPFEFTGPVRPRTAGSLGFPMKVVRTIIWSETPTAAQIAAVAPKTPDGSAKGGHAVMRCKFAHDGTLQPHCEILDVFPLSGGFAEAAARLEPDFKADISFYKKGELANDMADIPINFPGAETPAATEITDPRWIRTMDPASLRAMYPAKAIAARVTSGSGLVSCTVSHSGVLTNCQVVHEEPEGLGFGEAAVRVAEARALNPWTAQGNPVDGDTIRLPLVFKLPPEDPPKAAAQLQSSPPSKP